jgi:hypothetical protein
VLGGGTRKQENAPKEGADEVPQVETQTY